MGKFIAVLLVTMIIGSVGMFAWLALTPMTPPAETVTKVMPNALSAR